MTSKTRVWPVKSAIRPDIVRWPAVICSPVNVLWKVRPLHNTDTSQLWTVLLEPFIIIFLNKSQSCLVLPSLLKAFTWILTYLLTYLLTVGSSRHRHSHKQTALLTANFTKLCFLNSNTNSVFNSISGVQFQLWTPFSCSEGVRLWELPLYLLM